MRKALLCTVVALVATTLTASDLPVKRAVVFKNGIGFLTRSAEVAFVKGKATIELTPRAAYGGLWLTTGRGGLSIDRAVTRADEIPRVENVTSIPELLDANDGRNVTIEAGELKLSGILRSSADESFVTVTASGTSTAIAKNAIGSMTVSGTPATTRETMEAGVVIDLLAGEISESVPVTLTSLERGIGWTPEYEIRIGPDGRAELTLRAVLVNDVASLENAEVSFAVGYPSFQLRAPL